MRRITHVACCTLLFTMPVTAQFFDARNRAMGGVGVASTRYVNAGHVNPALLTRFGEDATFGLTLPVVGGFLNDEDQLVDAIDALQESISGVENTLNNGGTVSVAELTTLSNQLLALNGRTAYGTVGGGFALTLPSKSLAVSLFAHTSIDARAFVVVDPADVARIINANGTGNLDNLQTEGFVLGAAVTDVGLAFAHEFSLGNASLSIGIAPKFQRVDTFNYTTTIDTFEDSDFDADAYSNEDSNINVDFGAALVPFDGLTLGLAARNVISAEYDTVITNGNAFQYDVSPNVTLGAALEHGIITLAADVDLIAVERFDLNDGTQSIRVGFEIDAVDLLQFRGGYHHDFEGTFADEYTAGIGVSPFGIVRIDVAGMTSGSDSYGGVVQLSVTF